MAKWHFKGDYPVIVKGVGKIEPNQEFDIEDEEVIKGLEADPRFERVKKQKKEKGGD